MDCRCPRGSGFGDWVGRWWPLHLPLVSAGESRESFSGVRFAIARARGPIFEGVSGVGITSRYRRSAGPGSPFRFTEVAAWSFFASADCRSVPTIFRLHTWIFLAIRDHGRTRNVQLHAGCPAGPFGPGAMDSLNLRLAGCSDLFSPHVARPLPKNRLPQLGALGVQGSNPVQELLHPLHEQRGGRRIPGVEGRIGEEMLIAGVDEKFGIRG